MKECMRLLGVSILKFKKNKHLDCWAQMELEKPLWYLWLLECFSLIMAMHGLEAIALEIHLRKLNFKWAFVHNLIFYGHSLVLKNIFTFMLVWREFQVIKYKEK